MGEEAEHLISLFENRASQIGRSRDFTWVDASGTRHRLHEMTNSHLINCVKVCKNRGDNNVAEILQNEINSRNQNNQIKARQ